MKRLTWIFSAPLAVAVVVFAVVNRRDIAYDFWPLPFEHQAPAFAWAVFAFLVGLLCGGAAMWISGGRDRTLLWRRSREVAELKREVERMTRMMAPKSAGEPLESNLLPAPTPPGGARKGPIPGPYLDPRTADPADRTAVSRGA